MKKKIQSTETFVNGRLEVLEVSTSDTGVKKALIKIISEGQTVDKQRIYLKDTLNAGAEKFADAKMYLNHISTSERYDRPERSVNDYVATIKNPVFVDMGNGVSYVQGEAMIHGSPTYSVDDIYTWLKNIKEAGAAADLSIHAYLGAEQGEFNGFPVLVITAIESVISVDFVTTANAGGEVETVESLKTKENSEKGGRDMKIEELTLEELTKARPDLCEAIKKDAVANAQTTSETESLKSENSNLKKSLSDMKVAQKKESCMKEADAVIKESKLPESTEKRVREKIEAITITETTESIKAAVEAIVNAEKEYLESLSKTKVFGNETPAEQKGEKSVDEYLESIANKKAGKKK